MNVVAKASLFPERRAWQPDNRKGTAFMRILVALCVSLITSAAWAGDFAKEKFDNWHQWRGPLATGEAPKADPPTTWDAKTNIKWKAELPGRGSATPIVWGNNVFVLTAVPTEKK